MTDSLRRRSMKYAAAVPGGSRRRIGRSALATGLLAVMLGGCMQLPEGGPMTNTIKREAKDTAAPFLLVPVTRITLADLGTVPPEDFSPLASQQPAPDSVIHVGDMISVTLWEYGNGLLGPVSVGSQTPGLIGAQSATVPNQTVDRTGTIIVPFAGEIPAAGHTTRQVQAAIVAGLRGKANDAQVLVQIVQTSENAVTVTGDVNHPGRFPLAPSGTHLLDAISTAGGTTGKARDMLVQLGRDGQARSVRLAVIHGDPVQNIYLKPGDVVTLSQEPQSVVVLGATNKNMVVPFAKSRVTLAETLGEGGGLSDHLADPYGVYVLRYESTELASKLQVDALPDYMVTGKQVPVVYQINMRTADGLLLAQNFVMRDHDLVYVADAETVQLAKLAGLFNLITAIFKNNNLHSYTNQFNF